MKKLVLLILVAVIGTFNVAQAQDAGPKGYGILFYADWCGSCKILDPKYQSAKKGFSKKDIEFIKLDMTNPETRKASEAKLKEKGLDSILKTYGYGTGFALVYDAQKQEVVETVTKTHDVEDIVAAFGKVS